MTFAIIVNIRVGGCAGGSGGVVVAISVAVLSVVFAVVGACLCGWVVVVVVGSVCVCRRTGWCDFFAGMC